MKRPITSRRTQLLARSALCGVLGAMAIGASSAAAQVTGVGTITSTNSNGGAVGVVSGGGVTHITTNADRSIVNWTNLTVTPTEALNFYFNHRSDIVVNRVAGAASIDGILNGCMATCATTGGNIWILSTGGVLIGANTQINTGGFLASTGSLTDGDILDGDMNFAFTGAPANSTISVAGGASLNTNGGSLALIAPVVTTAAGSTVTATNGGDVIYGSAENYNVTFAPTGTDDLDLLTFQVPSQSDGAGGTPGLTLNGTTTANQVFAAIVSKGSVAASILLGGNITATTASGENGDIVLSAGSGFTNGVADSPMGFDASITQNTTSTLTGVNVTMRASDNIVADEINASGRVWLNSEWTNVSQTGAITANILRAEAGGDVILTNAGNDFNFLTYIESQGVNGIDIVDLDGFEINDYIFHLGGGARTANLTALTGSISATGSGVIQVGTLNVSAVGGSIDLGAAANNSTNLGTITAGAGDFNYRSLLDVNVAGVVTASNVTLISLAGQITQSGTGSILSGQLQAFASSGISLNSALNDVGTILRLSSGSGDVVYAQTNGFQITGALTATNGGMSLTSTNGSITQTASGIITTALLNANAGDDLILDQANVVGVVGNLTAGGGAGDDLVFNSTLGYAINGTVGGDDVTLTSGGSIGQGIASRVIANLLTLDAVGGIDLPNGGFGTGNDIDALGLVTAGGAVSIASISALDLTADIDTNGADLTLYSQSGITQSGGVLRVGTLYAQSRADGINLNQANEVAALGHIFAEGSGNFTFRNAGNVVVNGMVEVIGDNISLTSDTGSVVLNGVGMRAATLSVSAQTGINLNRANSIGTVTALTTAAGDITFLNSGSFDLAGAVSADNVTLTSTSGAITQSSGIITADVLTVSAASGIDLDQVNAVATLGGLTAGATGDVTFTNSGDVDLTGDITSGSGGVVSITSTGGAIDQSAGAITADWLKLNAATTITQDSGATFTSTALSLTSVGNVSLAQANSFTSLYDLAVGGDLTLRNAGSIDMGPTLSGFYNSGGALTLTSDTGSIFTTGAGVVTSRLTASAAGSITLDGTIGSLGDVTAGGNILLNNYSTALDLTGDVTGQTVSLYAGGGVAQSGGRIDASRINVITNGAISLTGANEIDVVGRLSTDPSFSGTGANITLRNVGNIVLDYLVEAPGATVTFTSDSGAITQTSFSAITANRLIASAAAGITIYDGVNNVATIGGLASVNGDIVYRDINGFDIQGDITANSAITRGAMLVAGGTGAITQTSGILDVGYFRGIAGSGITLGGANLIRRLISSQVNNGALTLNTTTDLSVDGTVAANTVSLTTPGAITQAANAQIWTTTLNASAVNGINLTASGFGANNITNLGVITNTTSGGIVVTNATPTNLTGNITAAGQAVSISNTLGGINQTGGVITAATLSLSAASGINATRANDVDTIAGLAAGTGDIVFRDVDGYDLAGNVTSADIVSLLNDSGSITQSAGIIATNLLTATGTGNITLGRANEVSLIGSLITGGDIVLNTTLGLTVFNEITGGNVSITSGGTFTQDNDGDITASSLTVSAATGINLTNAGNNVSTIAGLGNSGTGGIAFGQTNGFVITGGVSAVGQTVSLSSVSGAINQTGSVITAGTLNASAAGALTLNQANNVTSLGVITTGGSFLFRDVDGFDLTGNVTVANQLVMLAQNGSITQTGGIITASDINAMATVDLLLGSANQINTISSLVAANNLLYRQVGDLSVPTISAAGTVSLYSTTGDITQTGTITADTLVLGAGDDITLGRNFVSKLGRIDAGGDFDASNAGGLSSGALELTDDITVGGAMTLVNPGAITQTGGAITAGSLTIDTDGALTATGANSVTGAAWLTVDGDVTWNSAGDLNLRLTTPGAASITSTAAIVLDGGGASSVGGLLSLGAVTGISQAQTLTVSDFGNLTNTTSGGINLTTASWVELEGNVTAAGQTVALNVTTGGIIQNAGVITANRFSSTTTQGAFLNQINNVAQLGVINAGAHNFIFRTLGDLLIDGDITSALTVNLTSATGGITQTAGSDITAGGLTVWAETGINLTNAGNDVDRLMTMINLGSGGIAYTQTDGFLIDSTIRALNQTVSLTSLAGGISETGTTFAQIEAGTLNASAAGALTLHRNNDVDNLGVVSAGNGFTFNDIDGFNLTGNLTGGGAVVLDAQNGSIVQTGGVITAVSIDAAASGNLDLGSANVVGAVTALGAGGDILYRQVGDLSVPAISVVGSLSLYSTTGSITQTGALSAATFNAGAATGIALTDIGNTFAALGNLTNATSGGISVYEADDINLTGAISTGAAQSVTLAAFSGAITQQTGATVETGALTLSATAGATLDGDNDVDALGTISVGPTFSFNDVDSFDIGGDLYATTANLTSGGAITQSTGVLGVGTLSLTAASATLDGANDIDTLGDVDVTGDMSFHDIGDINLNGDQTVGGTLSLTSGGVIRQIGSGVLDVGRFEADGVWGVLLGNSGNAIDSLGDISVTSGMISITSTSPLTIDGDLTATGVSGAVTVQFGSGGVAMTTSASITTGGNVQLIGAGDIVLGAITADWLRTISHSGTISSTAAPTIVANRLTGSAAGSFVLTGSNIDINEFAFNAANEISLTGNNGPLDLIGQVTAQTVTLGSTGAITQSAGLVRATLATLSGGSIVANRANEVQTVNLNGASISFTNADSFAANVITSTGAVSLTSNTGNITQTASTGRIVADSLTASAATGLEFFGGQNDIRVLAGLSSTGGGVTYRDMGGFEITGNIDATGQTVELVSDGAGADGDDVVQTSGVITANRLQGTSAGDLLFNNANGVGQLGYLNAGGDIRYRGAASYTLQDNVFAGGGLILNSDTGSIQQFGGAIVADAFSGSAAQGITLSRVNDVDALGAVDSGAGDFNFRDIDSFDIAGLITSDNGIMLQAGGNITQSSGSIVTGTLSLFASGAAVVNGSGNDIDFLGLSTGMNALAFTDVDGFGISDRVFSSGAISLTATTGDIAEVAGGYLSANGLSVYASNGEIDLAGDNIIENVGDLVAGGDVTFHDTDGFLTFGSIAGDAVRLTTAAGGISQINGAIGANSLLVSADTGIDLSLAGNDVVAIAGMTNATSGGITYMDANSVSIAGAVNALGQTVTFTVGNDLSQSGTGVINARSVQGWAGGDFNLGALANNVSEIGPISAIGISFRAAGALTLTDVLSAGNYVSLRTDGALAQAAGAAIFAPVLRVQAAGDITLTDDNDVDSIELLLSTGGNVSYADTDGFSLDGAFNGDIWAAGAGGTMTLTARGPGSITQTGAGLIASTLTASAGGDIVLDRANQVGSLGAMSSGGDIVFVDLNDIALTGDIVTGGGGAFVITSTTGAVAQTAGLITSQSINGSAAGAFTLNNFDGALGAISSIGGDIDISNAADITLNGLISTSGPGSVTLTSGGYIQQGASGRVQTALLKLSAGDYVDLTGPLRNDVDGLGSVSAGTSFTFADDDDFALTGDIDIDGGAPGTTASLQSIAGRIDQTGGVIMADGLSLTTATGADLSGPNRVGALEITNGAGDVYFTNAQDLGVVSATSGGLVDIQTTTGRLDVLGQIDAGSIVLTGANGAYAAGLLQATGDVTLTAVTGNAMAAQIISGDDVLVQATAGSAQVQDISLYAGLDPEADGQNLTITAAGDAFLGAANEAAITSQYLNRISGAGTVSVTSTGGNAGVFLAGMNTAVDTLSAGGDDGTASVVVAGNITLGSVSGDNVLIRSTNGVVNVAAVALGGGDYTLYGEDFSTGAFAFAGPARDISITDTAGDLTIDADMFAQRNLTVEALSGSLIDGTGFTVLSAGNGGSGDLSIVANNITMSSLSAQGNVTLDAGVTGHIAVGQVAVLDDYNLIGGSFSTGALAPTGLRAGTWTITDGGGFDFSGQTLTYDGDIVIHAADVITGGSVQSILGSILIDSLSDIDVEGLHAAGDITAESASDLIIDTATSIGGDINLLGRAVRVDGFVDAARDVLVTATDGQAEVESATAGRDIMVAATDGDVRLGQAILTGVTGDLNVLATNGAATLGAIDFSTIGSNNYLQRASGSTGTVSVVATGGGAAVYLDHSDSIDLVQGEDVDVTVENGDLTIGVLTALTDDVYAEALDGTLTVGDAIAGNGGVGLYAFGGDLTLTGSVYGALGVVIETDGLLDGRLAVSIDTAGDLDLAGGSVLMDSISADGFITVAATDGDAYVEFANAGGSVQVGSLTGDATLRGAEAPDGIAVFAANTATFGADDRSLITAANYGITGGGCGCGPGTGIAVISLDGDVVVNLQSVTGGFDVIGAAIDGDATVYLATGNLTIGDLAAFNIDVEVAGGTLETAFSTSSGGNYRVKAQDFLGDVLNPTLFAGTLGDYTVIDTLGDLAMNGVSIMAQGDIRIEVQGGALTGDAQLSSISGTGQGDVTVTAAGITLGSVEADRDVVLNASAGVVDVAASVTIGRDYTLTGQSFSAAALTPLGARAGTFDLTGLGGLDYSAGDLSYGGDIAINVAGALVGGDITSATGSILIGANGVNTGALSAANGEILAVSSVGSVLASSAMALESINLYAGDGSVSLGAAALLGTGANTLLLYSAGGGNVTFGAASSGSIGAGHVFTSAGSSTNAAAAAIGGDAFVNLDRSDALSAIIGAGDVGVTVRSGDFTVGQVGAGGRVDIDGPDGQLTVGAVFAGADVAIGGGDVTLTDGEIGQALTIDATGDIDFRPSGRIDVTGEISLAAGGRVSQAADAGLTATGLTVSAGDAVRLTGVNQIEVIRAVDTAAGGFAYRSTRIGGFDIAGPINAAGQTVDLRADNGGVFQSGGAIVAGRLTGASDGGVWLAGGNLIDELGDFANTGGAFFLNVDQALSIVGAVESAAALRIQSGAMTIASTGAVRSTGSGDAVVLASDGVFTNNSGADGVQAANGRWLIYSQAAGNPVGSTSGNNFGGLGGRSYYGSAYDFGSGGFSATPNAGNRFVYAYQPTLTVTPISQQVTYNGQIPTLGALIAGLINGDAAADAWSGAPTLSGATSKNAGTYGLSAALGSLLSDMNYAFSFGSGTLVIDPKALTGTVTANNRTYDGGVDATGSISLGGVVAGDAVVATATGFRFADKNAGLGKIVTALGAALSGADAGNYTLGSVGTAVADILRRSLTGVLTANNKTYDGTTGATGSIGLGGVLAGDAVSASGTFSFADKNAGLGKVVSVNGLALSGVDAGNYDLGPISGVADILRRSISGTVVANNKTYDGSAVATGSISLTGVVAGDDIGANGAFAFDSRNAGVGRSVSAANAALSGADAGNYTLTGVANGIADILRRAISVTASNQSKRFGQGDPSLTYVVGGGGLVAGDVLTGGLVRAAGETAGVYAIGQGDLAASSNYVLTFTPGEFVIQIPPMGGVQSLQMLRTLGETSAFALDRDPSPGLIVSDGGDEPDPDDQAGVRPTSD